VCAFAKDNYPKKQTAEEGQMKKEGEGEYYVVNKTNDRNSVYADEASVRKISPFVIVPQYQRRLRNTAAAR